MKLKRNNASKAVRTLHRLKEEINFYAEVTECTTSYAVVGFV